MGPLKIRDLTNGDGNTTPNRKMIMGGISNNVQKHVANIIRRENNHDPKPRGFINNTTENNNNIIDKTGINDIDESEEKKDKV